MDSSGSVKRDNFNKAKEFIKAFISDANIDTGEARVGLLTFSNDADIQFNLDDYADRVSMIDAVDQVPYVKGSTNTADALEVAREDMFTSGNGDRSDMPNVIVLFTDGGSDNMLDTIEQARLTRLDDITILVVSIGTWLNQQELNEIASDPDDKNIFPVPDFDQINDIASDLRKAICNGKIVDNFVIHLFSMLLYFVLFITSL